MRRFLITLSLVIMGFGGFAKPPELQAQTAICEGYCSVVGFGCYLFTALLVGREPCELMYEGCVSGCVVALQEIDNGDEDELADR